jgi:hypothetical protein
MSERAVRLEPLTLSIERLLSKVQAGEVRVPAFQRRFRWKPNQVAELFDSIYRSFPIGTLLFWKRRADAEHVRLGQVEFDAPAFEAGQWVIDGQQRIISLANVLLLEAAAPPFVVSFNLETERFSSGPGRGPTVPLQIAVDSERLVEWLTARQLAPDLRRRAIRLGTALREYQLPVWSIGAESESDVREIFGRLNSRGTQLKPAELFEALEAKPTKSLASVSERLLDYGFGVVSPKLVHQTIRAIQGDDFTRDRVGRVKDPAIFTRAFEGLGSAIVLLKQTGIPHLSLLPFQFTLVLLGAFFAHHPSASMRTRELLKRWLWRATVTEQLSGKDLGWLRLVIKTIAQPEALAVTHLLEASDHHKEKLRSRDWVLSPRFDPRHSRSRLEALALLALFGPGGLPGLGAALGRGERVFREIIPMQRLLRGLKQAGFGVEQSLFATLANRGPWIDGRMQSPPALVELDQRVSSGETLERAKALRHRSDYLTAWVPLFLESKMRTVASDRPALESLELPDEDADAA